MRGKMKCFGKQDCGTEEYDGCPDADECNAMKVRDEAVDRAMKYEEAEGWCLITFCPLKGPVRGDPEYGLAICERHWKVLHKEAER